MSYAWPFSQSFLSRFISFSAFPSIRSPDHGRQSKKKRFLYIPFRFPFLHLRRERVCARPLNFVLERNKGQSKCCGYDIHNNLSRQKAMMRTFVCVCARGGCGSWVCVRSGEKLRMALCQRYSNKNQWPMCVFKRKLSLLCPENLTTHIAHRSI